MAKGGGGIYKSQKNDIKALRLAQNDDRMGDFKFTQDQLSAIFGNLSTSGRGIASSLSASSARETARAQLIAARGARATNRQVSGGQAAARNLFGTAMGNVIGSQFTQAKGVAQATGTQTKGLLKSVGTTVQGGKLALNAERAGASEAASGAAYALATALKYRAGQDADAVAEKQLALDTMKTQAKSQWMEFKKESDYASAAALKQQSDAAATLFSQGAPLVTSNSAQLSAILADNPDITWTEASKLLDIDPNDPGAAAALPILSRAFTYMKSNGQPVDVAIQQASSDLYSTVPGYDVETMNKLLASGTAANQTNAFIDEIAPIMKDGLTANGTDSAALYGSADEGLWHTLTGQVPPDDRTQIYNVAAKYGYTDTQVLDLLNQYFPSRSATASGAIPGVYGTTSASGTTVGGRAGYSPST